MAGLIEPFQVFDEVCGCRGGIEAVNQKLAEEGIRLADDGGVTKVTPSSDGDVRKGKAEGA